ncbi:MAG TPA: hypothetical protein VGK46_08225 [Saprospiraceae bacterium]|jgi:contractile injection system tube protein
MPSSPLSPKLLKGGIVLLDPNTSAVQKIIPLQYNPETVSRTLQPKRLGEGASKSDALRITGPPEEAYKLEIELDATDLLEVKDQQTLEMGIQPMLTILEKMVYPESSQLIANNAMASSGSLEIIPTESSLVLFIWSKNRVVPVQLTDLSITEEAFDTNLNPIRAKVSLSLKVMTVRELGFDHKGGNLYLAYQKQKEQLANKFIPGNLKSLGINSI